MDYEKLIFGLYELLPELIYTIYTDASTNSYKHSTASPKHDRLTVVHQT